MYTQCPECDVAFRITAEVLQQAQGQVRCGGCGTAFNALDHLYEEPPDAGGATDDAGSKELLDTLEKLAGPEEVRIEDTGVEWLVLDDSSGEEDDPIEGSWNVEGGETGIGAPDAELDTAETTEQPALDEQAVARLAATPPDEMRYDDNTPLPDDFGEEEDEAYTPPPPTPQRRSTDFLPVETDEAQAELELSQPEDWTELLDEVGRTPAGNDDSAAGDLPLEIEEELAAIHDELSTLPESLIAEAVDVVEEITRSEPQLAEPTDEPAPDDVQPPADEPPAVDEAAPDDAAPETVAEDTADDSAAEEPADEARAPDPVEVSEAADDEVVSETDEAELTVDDVLQLEEEDPSSRAGQSAAADDDPAEMLDADDLLALAEDTGSREQIVDADAPDTPVALAEDESDEDEKPLVEYEESTGEFERAIQSAEDAIIAEREEQDADSVPADAPDDATDALDGDEGDDSADGDADGDGKKSGEDLSVVEYDDIAAMTANMQIDDELLKAMKDQELAASMTDEHGEPIVETIVMEGDAVRGMLDREERDDSEDSGRHEPLPKQPLRDPGSLVDTYMMNRADQGRSAWLSGKTSIALIVVLTLALVGQYIHTSREYLATFGFFNQTIGPVYRMFGQPVTPQWNIKGWQFEATNGSTGTDDDVLTISSRISNRSDQPLPYPLVHVSLTDRYEEIIGSRVLEPNEYLAGTADPSRPVPAGANFTAVITIASPSAEATGFKLNVCYRVAPGQVRCAIEDFKAP